MNTPKPAATLQPSSTRESVQSFAVYALSRGSGVPQEAREAQRRVVALAEEDQKRGVKVSVQTTRIGLEGETKVCIAYEDRNEGTRAYERARDIVKNVDLVDLKIEPCAAKEKDS